MLLAIQGTLLSRAPIGVRFRAHERMHEPSKISARFAVALADVSLLEAALGQAASVHLLSPSPRVFHGMLQSIRPVGSLHDGQPLAVLELGIVAQIARLALRRQSRVFLDVSCIDVAHTLLTEHRVAFRDRLYAAPPKRELITQRSETDLAFVQRILAEEGVFFSIDHPNAQGSHQLTGRGEGDVVVFGDYAPYLQPIDDKELVYRPARGAHTVTAPNHLQSFSLARGLAVRSASLRSYDYRRPRVELAERAADAPGEHENFHVDETGGLGSESEPRLPPAQVRLEQARRNAERATGESTCPSLSPGRVFSLSEHEVPSHNGDFIVTDVKHRGFGDGLVPVGKRPYENRFRAIPGGTAPRPARPRPRVLAAETAIVVGPPGQEVHTDALGRIQVRFHWDLDAARTGRSSCWLRVAQPWSGAGYGAQFIPRVGTEVLVDYLDGNPDRPLVVASLYNATSPLPFAPAAGNVRSGVRSRSVGGEGFNEISFEDVAGQEMLTFHAQRDRLAIIRRDDREAIGQNQIAHVEQNRTTTIGKVDSLSVKEALVVRIAEPSETGTEMRDNFIGQATAGASMGMGSKDFTVDAAGDVSLSAAGKLSLNASDIAIVSTGPLKLEGVDIEIKASGSITIIAGGPVTVIGAEVSTQGGVIKEN